MSVASAASLLTLLTVGASAPPPSFPELGKPTYTLSFAEDVSAPSFARHFPGLATWGYFGAEPAMRAQGKPVNQRMGFTSRAWPGTDSVNVDPGYCAGAHTPDVEHGALRITAYQLDPADVTSCGMGRRHWASAYVTTQPSFAQAYGYFEIEAKLPCDPGRWPAFWLLPATKTKENGGRLAEIDVFEHYGGPRTLMSQGRPVVINRVGQPFSTLHYGVTGAENKAGNAQQMPPITDAQRQAFCAARHSFGVLWTPSEFRFYIDRAETFRTANPGVSDPHYMVVNMDVSQSAGNPDDDPQPSVMSIYAMRAWALPR